MDTFSRVSLIGLVVFLMCLAVVYSLDTRTADIDRNARNADANNGLSGAKRTAMCSTRRFIF